MQSESASYSLYMYITNPYESRVHRNDCVWFGKKNGFVCDLVLSKRDYDG